MSSFETILTEISEGIFTITLNRPDRMNAFTDGMMHEMIAAFDLADADDAVRAIIVTGSGDRAFCAGADLAAGAATWDYTQGANGKGENEIERDGGGRLTLRIFNCKKPVIGAINGAAVGVGATMQLAMDIRIASTKAKYGFVFARRGIVPEAASSWFLPRLVGISKALEWCYSGKVFDVEEAHAAGLVRSIHAPEDLIPNARALAKELTADSAPVSVALTRQMFWRMLGADHPMEAHRFDSHVMMSRGASADSSEGIMSFLEKRPAAFPDSVSKNMPHLSPWTDDPEFS